MSEELLGREVAESLVRTNGVVGMFPGEEFAIEFGDGERKGGDLIEFLGMGAVGAFDLAIVRVQYQVPGKRKLPPTDCLPSRRTGVH